MVPATAATVIPVIAIQKVPMGTVIASMNSFIEISARRMTKPMKKGSTVRLIMWIPMVRWMPNLSDGIVKRAVTRTVSTSVGADRMVPAMEAPAHHATSGFTSDSRFQNIADPRRKRIHGKRFCHQLHSVIENAGCGRYILGIPRHQQHFKFRALHARGIGELPAVQAR
jgi:hypothetical protein